MVRMIIMRLFHDGNRPMLCVNRLWGFHADSTMPTVAHCCHESSNLTQCPSDSHRRLDSSNAMHTPALYPPRKLSLASSSVQKNDIPASHPVHCFPVSSDLTPANPLAPPVTHYDLVYLDLPWRKVPSRPPRFSKLLPSTSNLSNLHVLTQRYDY